MIATTPWLTIRRLDPSSVAIEYPDWYVRAGGNSRRHHPGLVYLALLDQQPVGVAACYLHDPSTAYLQFAGLFEEYRGLRALPYLRILLAEIHKDYPRLYADIARENHPALRLALKAGFEIVGTRLGGTPLDGPARLFVTLMKEADHATV